MSQDEAVDPPSRPSRRRRVIRFLVAFAISLVVARVFESVGSAETIEAVTRLQEEWSRALKDVSPLGIGKTYWTELNLAFFAQPATLENPEGSGGAGVLAPVVALGRTVVAAARSAWAVGLIQLALGALAVMVLNFRTSGRRTVLLDTDHPIWAHLVFAPILVVVAASLLSLGLWALMKAALYSLGWATGLAASAAGATGTAGFCWYCVTKLAEKGAEHTLTSRI